MRHTQAYVICATPRSGTTLLCDLLTDVGKAGKPDSFFRRQSIYWWADYLGVPSTEWDEKTIFDQSYLKAVIKEGTNGTDMFGMRLMWEHVAYLSDVLDQYYPDLSSDYARIQAAFGPVQFLHLSRDDKVAQAVSRVKAEQTGLWHVHSSGAERERLAPASEAQFDSQRLIEQLEEYQQQDESWERWFQQQGIKPVCISYEQLSADPQATLKIVLSAIGLNPSIVHNIKLKTKKLSDDTSEQWVQRLRAML